MTTIQEHFKQWYDANDDLTLRAAFSAGWKAARASSIEEAAAVCESEAWRLKTIAVSQQSAATNSKSIGLSVAADKIRALIGKEST